MKQQDVLLQEYFEITAEISEEQFSGAYFDGDGKLHIVVTEEMSAMSKSGDIIYEVAKYSYEQLRTFQDKINAHAKEIGFTASGIDQEDNKVVIYRVLKIDTDLLYDIIPKDSVKIVAEDHSISKDSATHTVQPGTIISNTSNSTYGSITCGVMWDNSTTNKKYGFMTAGHLGSVGDSVSYGGSSMGTITRKQQSGSVDAALILNNQNSNVFNYSSSVCDGKEYEHSGGSYPQNTVIYAYGATSTSVSGTITDTSYSNTFSNILFTDLVLTSATCQGGDSGGPVLTSYSDNYSLTGLIKGRVGSNNYMVYVKMSNIQNAFDLRVLSVL